MPFFEDTIANTIIGCAIEVHRNLGPGLLESSYQECLSYELKQTGLFIEREKPMPLIYKDIQLNVGYRMDVLVENLVVVELKTVEAINKNHIAQTLTYMKLGNYKLGLILNFNESMMKDGIKRLIL